MKCLSGIVLFLMYSGDTICLAIINILIICMLIVGLVLRCFCKYIKEEIMNDDALCLARLYYCLVDNVRKYELYKE